jgi:hypothetical protein
MSVILATQETENWKSMVRSQSRQIVHETLSGKKPSQERAGGVAQNPNTQKNLKKLILVVSSLL